MLRLRIRRWNINNISPAILLLRTLSITVILQSLVTPASTSNSGVTIFVDEDRSANVTSTLNANVTSLSSVFFGLTDAASNATINIDESGRTSADADLYARAVLLTDEDPGAVCLDGSPAVLHFSRGSSTTRGWIIHHNGGGWCTSMNDCCLRSVTNLGTSIGQTANFLLAGGALGYLDRLNETNPYMKDYNIAALHYCDGASFSGNLDQPMRNVCRGLGQPATVYSRGFRILKAAFQYLARQGLHTAQEVVISGNSAGGKSTYLHADWWSEHIRSIAPTARVYGLPDDGMFLDFDRDYSYVSFDKSNPYGNVKGRYTQQIQWVYHMMNTTAAIDQSCIDHYQRLGTPWKCMFGQYALPYIETPMFILQTIYDSWQMQEILVHQTYEQPVREFAQLAFTAANIINDYPWHGGWLTGCYKHCGLWREIDIDGVNAPVAFEMFKNQTRRVWSQGLMDFPCTTCCQKYVEPQSDAVPTPSSSSFTTLNIIGPSAAPYLNYSGSKSNNTLGIALGITGGVVWLLLMGYLIYWRRKAEKSLNAKDKFKAGIKAVISNKKLNELKGGGEMDDKVSSNDTKVIEINN